MLENLQIRDNENSYKAMNFLWKAEIGQSLLLNYQLKPGQTSSQHSYLVWSSPSLQTAADNGAQGDLQSAKNVRHVYLPFQSEIGPSFQQATFLLT